MRFWNNCIFVIWKYEREREREREREEFFLFSLDTFKIAVGSQNFRKIKHLKAKIINYSKEKNSVPSDRNFEKKLLYEDFTIILGS